MGWFDQVMRRFDNEAGLPALAEQIADRCFEAVWQRVQSQLLSLAPTEARGYIRARASEVLRTQVSAAADREKLTTTQRTTLYTLTANTIVQRVQLHARAITRQPTRRVA